MVTERLLREVLDMRYYGRHLILLLSFLFSSCYATSSSLDLREQTSVPSGETVVFGRVNVIMDDKPVTWGYTFMGRQDPGMFRILVQFDATPQVLSHGLTDNGVFVWHLPPDGYTIAGFNYHVGTSGRIMAQFRVPQGISLLYIGTLEIRMKNYISYRMVVVDESDEAKRDLKSRFPELQGDVVKALMKLEVQH
jgi:hypothetical protein